MIDFGNVKETMGPRKWKNWILELGGFEAEYLGNY